MPPQPVMEQGTLKRTDMVPIYLRFAFGGIAGCGAGAVTHPMDVVKNRMQISGEVGAPREFRSFGHALLTMYREAGVRGFYNGMSAMMLKQATYSSIRMGVFNTLNTYVSTSNQGKPTSLFTKASIGFLSGGIAAYVTSPSELCLIRMSTDQKYAPHLRRNYRNVLEAIWRIAHEEGAATLWRGSFPTVLRATTLNAVQLTTYNQTKERLILDLHLSDTISTHFCASMLTGLVTTASVLPFDIAKTRIQNMQNTGVQYAGVWDVWRKIVANEGLHSLWKGFLPYYSRAGPQNVLIFIILEQLNEFYLRRMLQ